MTSLPPSFPSRRRSQTPSAPAALAPRILRISARYRGTRYQRDPLGEGPSGAVDRDPLINRARVDCQTFVEQVLAEAVSRNTGELLPVLTRIRYRDGIIGFDTRNHYLVTDWLSHNRWLIRDLTPTLGKGREHVMEKVIDRAAFFRRRGAPGLGAGLRPQRDRTAYLPRRLIPGIAGQLPEGSLLIWVQDRPGIIAAHCGFALRRSDGAVMFRHASEQRGRVLDEPLLDYLRRAPRRIVGLKVCQAQPWLDTSHRRR